MQVAAGAFHAGAADGELVQGAGGDGGSGSHGHIPAGQTGQGFARGRPSNDRITYGDPAGHAVSHAH